MIGKVVGLICAVLIAIAVVYWIQYPSDTEPNRSSTQPSSNKPVTMTFNGSIISRPDPLTFTLNSVKIKPEETKYIIQTTKKYIIHPDGSRTDISEETKIIGKEGDIISEETNTISEQYDLSPVITWISKYPETPIHPMIPRYLSDYKSTKYFEMSNAYGNLLSKYDNESDTYFVVGFQTVDYGGMTLKTNELELLIHELVNKERIEYGLEPLDYDYGISFISRSHSNDMSTNNYFSHVDSFGGSSNVRGIFYGYPDCGDKETIRLLSEFEKHKMEYESGANSSDQMYDLLQKMLSQLNSAIYKGMLIEGLAENLFQNNLYSRYWITNGVITSYDWDSPEEIAKSTVEGWMNSKGHRSNILYPYFESEGIGVVVSSDHKVYITQNFC